jgi:hypothetical protein
MEIACPTHLSIHLQILKYQFPVLEHEHPDRLRPLQLCGHADGTDRDRLEPLLDSSAKHSKSRGSVTYSVFL